MNPLLQSALASIARAILIGSSGFLVQRGIWSQSAAETYMTALSLFVVGLGWSLWEKYKSRIKFLTALESPVGTTEAKVNSVIALGGGASVKGGSA